MSRTWNLLIAPGTVAVPSLHLALALSVVGLLSGCTVDPTAAGALKLHDLDFNDYACKVQPVAAARCSMNACHGREDKAYRVYSPGKLRLDPPSPATLLLRDAPMRLAEVQANFASAKAVAFLADGDPPEASPLLRKPLSRGLPGAGAHVGGGELFFSFDDPGYLAIKAWISGEQLPAGCDLLTTLMQNP